MIKEIVKDPVFLSRKSVEAQIEDLSIVQDMLDTIDTYKDRCVGMAANMIGYTKKIAVINHKNNWLVLINPRVIKAYGNRYECSEGCLCHNGIRKAVRFEKLQVEYLDINWKKKTQTFSGYSAEILQHELDHMEGILI